MRFRNSRSLGQLLQLAFIGDLVYLYLFYRFVQLVRVDRPLMSTELRQYGDITEIGAQINFALTGLFTILRMYTMFAVRGDASGRPKLA